MGCWMIADLVRESREARGWTQTDLAEATGLRQTYISKIENGEIGLPRDHNIDKLARVFGLARADFYEAAGIQAPRLEPDDDPARAKVRGIVDRPRVREQLAAAGPLDDSLTEALEDALVAVLKARRGH